MVIWFDQHKIVENKHTLRKIWSSFGNGQGSAMLVQVLKNASSNFTNLLLVRLFYTFSCGQNPAQQSVNLICKRVFFAIKVHRC